MLPGISYNPEVLQKHEIPGVSPVHHRYDTGLELERGDIGMNGIRILAGLAIAAALCLMTGAPNALAQAGAAPPTAREGGAKTQSTTGENKCFNAPPAQQ